MAAFQGVAIETKPGREFQVQTGFKSVAIEVSQRQYFETQTGFKSIAIEYDVGGSAIKIWHYNP